MVHAHQNFMNTSKTFQSHFPLALSVHGASASTKPSTATCQIRRYTLEREVCCACRVATAVITVPLLELAETSILENLAEREGRPTTG